MSGEEAVAAAAPPGTIDFSQVDAFTDVAFGGNPAAVVVLAGGFPPAEWMQMVAREKNLSETSFLVPAAGGGGWHLRWFTPAVEVDLCGHATLCAAHHLYEAGLAPAGETIRFTSKGGELTARQSGGQICLEFPAAPATELPLDDPRREVLSRALGAGAGPHLWVGRTSIDDLLVEVGAEAAVRSLDPDLKEMVKAGGRGVIVTAPSDKGAEGGYDFVSRFFGPCAGIDEDPVTGSAHCGLGPYWMPRLGRPDMTGYQASARGGKVRVVVREGGGRVELWGGSVTVAKGQLLTSSWIDAQGTGSQ